METQTNNIETGKPSFFVLPRSCSFGILVKSVSCGENHTAIVTKSLHLYMVGSNSMGQLGIAELPQTTAGSRKTYTGSPCLVDRLKNQKVESVACGKDFTLAILSGGTFN